MSFTDEDLKRLKEKRDDPQTLRILTTTSKLDYLLYRLKKVYDEHKSCLERLESLQSENADWVDKYAEACRQRDAVKAQYDSLRALAGDMVDVWKESQCNCLGSPSGNSIFDYVCNRCRFIAAYSKATKGHGDE